MKNVNMDNIRALSLIFIRYNKDIVLTQADIHILKMHIGVLGSKMSEICFKNSSHHPPPKMLFIAGTIYSYTIKSECIPHTDFFAFLYI